jgi:hydrogenase-1 operon protein HyaF
VRQVLVLRLKLNNLTQLFELERFKNFSYIKWVKKMSQFSEINIPVSIVGPGSQEESEDGMVLDYMSMPNDMSVFHAPIIMNDNLDDYPGAREVLEQAMEGLKTFVAKGENTLIDLSQLDDRELDFINKFLGEGEVAIIYNKKPSQIRVQESVLAGVWRLAGHDGEHPFQALEVGLVPDVIKTETFSNAQVKMNIPEELPEGVINAPSLLSELNDKSFAYQSDGEAHIVNLTLLPQSPEDLELMGECMGDGPTTFLSRGYGSCRVTATNLQNVWWVQFFNSEDKLILNTIEVVDVPLVTQASIEDIEDSQERLEEMMESVREN